MHQTQIAKPLVVLMTLSFVISAGCHRSYYRRQADTEAQCLVQEKAIDPRWNSSDGSIDVDPYSRMFNPFSSDHPPLPTDDPTSSQLMQCVDGRRGFPQWHANGDTSFVENPQWQSYLPRNERGEVVLTLERAYQLALLHSPDYQSQIETLYLSALDVSLERFGFETQMFAGFNSILSNRGRLRTGTGRHSTQLINSLGANGEGLRLNRLGTTGTNFAVGIANTLLFNISGSGSRSANSLIDFSLIQPLLRNGGRDRVMESLTLSERALLANVRQMDRFRRGFYLQVATGRSPGAGPNRGGQFLNLPAGSNLGVGGFYGLLVQKQQIRNQEFNVSQLEEVVEQFRALFQAGQVDAFQLRLLEAGVFSQQTNLVDSRIRYEAALDRYVQSLGLPPDLPVVIDDDFLDQFQFVSNEINDRLLGIANLRKSIGVTTAEVVSLLPQREEMVQESNFRFGKELKDNLDKLVPELTLLQDAIDEVLTEDVTQIRGDLAALESTRPKRIEYLEGLKAAIDQGEIMDILDPVVFSAKSIPMADDLLRALEGEGIGSAKSITDRLQLLKADIELTKDRIRGLEPFQANSTPVELFLYLKANVQEAIPQQISTLNNAVVELSLLQARSRSNSIEIIDVDISAETAVSMARCFRRDWMNARASLVDDWRRIEFVANQLESQLDLVLQADVGNVGSNPLKLDYRNGQIRAGVRFDSPLVRLVERNQYRETLIRFQQSRRQLYQFEDEVKRNLRDIVRNINRDKLLFELNRRAIDNQIDLIESSRLNLEAPPAAGGGRTLGDAAARDLTDAFNGLNNIQNRTVGTWIEYEILRRNLDFDMGTMQVDEFGAWVDPGLIDGSIGLRVAAQMGIELDCDFCDERVTNPGSQESFVMQGIDDPRRGNADDDAEDGSASQDRNAADAADADARMLQPLPLEPADGISTFQPANPAASPAGNLRQPRDGRGTLPRVEPVLIAPPVPN